METRTKTDHIVIHHAATKPTQDWGAKQIRKIHVVETGWSDIGYHYIITRSGAVEKGRNENLVGAHCPKVNKTSIGICLIGGIDKRGHAECNFTEAQFKALDKLLRKLLKKYPAAVVGGHKDYDPLRKPFCPPFSVELFVDERGI